MTQLILPEGLLVKEQYLALPSSQKEDYIDNVLKQILELNPSGITIPDVDKATYFGHATIWHHLELLASRAECLKMERGDTNVYHSNKIIAAFPELKLKGKLAGSHIYFDLVENTYGKFIRIQKHIPDSRSSTHLVRNGIVIPTHLLDELINTFNEVKAHLNERKDV